MIGLLRKDLYVAGRSVRMLLILALAFSMVPNMEAFGSTYAIMVALTVPLNAIAYDEKSRWDRFAAMLPCRTEHLVLTKYLLAYCFTVLAEAVLLLGAAVRNVITPGSTSWRELGELSVMLLTAALFMTALALPALYRFGSEKGRLVMILLLGCCVGAVLGLWGTAGKLPPLPGLSVPVVAGIAAALVVLATLASFRLSVYFYKKRQNGAYD